LLFDRSLGHVKNETFRVLKYYRRFRMFICSRHSGKAYTLYIYIYTRVCVPRIHARRPGGCFGNTPPRRPYCRILRSVYYTYVEHMLVHIHTNTPTHDEHVSNRRTDTISGPAQRLRGDGKCVSLGRAPGDERARARFSAFVPETDSLTDIGRDQMSPSVYVLSVRLQNTNPTETDEFRPRRFSDRGELFYGVSRAILGLVVADGTFPDHHLSPRLSVRCVP